MIDPDYLFVDAEEYRRQSLQKLRTQLNIAIESEDRTKFCAYFYLSGRILELSDRELAKLFQVSRPTIDRWMKHEAAPHVVGRAPILKQLLKMVEEKLTFYVT